MKIGIDASRAFEKERTGTEEYSYQLIRNLAMMGAGGHQIFLYARKSIEVDFFLSDNFQLKIISLNKFWTQTGLAFEMLKNKPDVLFIPSYAVPLIHPRKTVVTIHGLEYKYFPKCYSKKERLFLELNTLFSVKWSSKIIVPSENTKKDLIRFYNVDENKIKVVYHGVNRKQHDGMSPSKPKDNLNILFIGRLERKKNILNLIRAFELFKKNPPNSLEINTGQALFQRGNSKFNIQHLKLILAGKPGFGFREIEKAIKESLFEKDIILKNYISANEKDKLYKSAGLFILPSFCEGFGLPVLEAMSYGMPVICSDNSSLPEVAGDAALLIDPNNIKEIAETMSKIFNNDNLRNDMIEKGFENVKRFSWEKCARETMGVLAG